MKLLAKAALGALALGSLAVGVAQPAEARVVVGVSIGGPWGYYGPACSYWYQPVYWGGTWYQGPFCYRWIGGRRVFWVGGGWHINGWRGPWPHHFWWGRHGFVAARGRWAHFHHGHFDHHFNHGFNHHAFNHHGFNHHGFDHHGHDHFGHHGGDVIHSHGHGGHGGHAGHGGHGGHGGHHH